MKTFGKIIKWFCIVFAALFLCYCLVGIIPPACHKHITGDAVSHAKSITYTANDTGPDRIHFVEDNDEAMAWRLRLIDNAEHDILLTTFTWQEDGVGREITAALLRAAERGVHVHLLVDGYYGWKFLTGNPYMDALMESPNVHLRFYNRFNYSKDRKLHYHLHDKILVADDEWCILGGRNIQNKFLGHEGRPEERIRDFDLILRETEAGRKDSRAAIPQVQRYFWTLWSQPNHKDAVLATEKAERNRASEELHRLAGKLPARYPAAYAPLDWGSISVPTRKCTLITGDPSPTRKPPILGARLLELMKTGKHITIQTPYLMMDRTMYRAITDLNRGRQVDIITNSAATGSNSLGACDYLNQKKNILKTGSTVFENNGRATHAKAITIDDRLTVIGSCNMDMRSMYLDTELMLAVDSPELNAVVRRGMEELKSQSLQISANGPDIPGSRYVKVERTGEKRLGYTLLRGVIWIIRPYL